MFGVAVRSALVLIKLASRSDRVGGARQTVRNMLSIGSAASIRCKQLAEAKAATSSIHQQSNSISANKQRPAPQPESPAINSRKEINIKAKQQQTDKSLQLLLFFSHFV